MRTETSSSKNVAASATFRLISLWCLYASSTSHSLIGSHVNDLEDCAISANTSLQTGPAQDSLPLVLDFMSLMLV